MLRSKEIQIIFGHKTIDLSKAASHKQIFHKTITQLNEIMKALWCMPITTHHAVIFTVITYKDLNAIAEWMATLKHKVLVLSGKSDVGKSTFAAQLWFALADIFLC